MESMLREPVFSGAAMAPQYIGGGIPVEQEAASPAKLSLALLIREYCIMLRNQAEEIVSGCVPSAGFSPRHRKHFYLLTLRLIQGTDQTLSQLVSKLRFHSECVPPALFSEWEKHLQQMVEMGVGGLIDLVASLEKLLHGDDEKGPILSRMSIFGLYIRRLVVNFDLLSISEVASLFDNYKRYISQGSWHLHEATSSHLLLSPRQISSSDVEMSLEVSAQPSRDTTERSTVEVTPESRRIAEFEEEDGVVHTKKQAEFYIAKQIELIENAERHADTPEEIFRNVAMILRSHPKMLEAYYLAYLNYVRSNNYDGALSSLHAAFDFTQVGEHQSVHDQSTEGFRYASIKLGILHTRFGHRDEALTALREAVRLSQEANDVVCLQHGLLWLYKLEYDSPENKRTLLKNLIRNAMDKDITHVHGMAVQSLAYLEATEGSDPLHVFDLLLQSDILASQTSTMELVCAGLAQRSALWSFYGRGRLAMIISQLLLNLDTAHPDRDGHYMTTEGYALALANVARNLFDSSHRKHSERVLQLANSIFASDSFPCGVALCQCQLHLDFLDALHSTDWVRAGGVVSRLEDVDKREASFMRLQLCLWSGEAEEMESVLSKVQSEFEKQEKNMEPAVVEQRVRILIFETEWYCLIESYSDAMVTVVKALDLSVLHHLEYLEGVARMHVAHVQLHLHLPLDAVSMLDCALPVLLSQGSAFECARAHQLMAKCLVASVSSAVAPTCSPEERRAAVLTAVGFLKKAEEGFRPIHSYHRLKDTLFLMARLYHELDMVHERNLTAAEFKAIEEHFPTNATSRLDRLL